LFIGKKKQEKIYIPFAKIEIFSVEMKRFQRHFEEKKMVLKSIEKWIHQPVPGTMSPTMFSAFVVFEEKR